MKSEQLARVQKYGAEVWCHVEMDNLRREECLCLNCEHLGACEIAEAGFHLCKQYNVAYAMTRCPKFTKARSGPWMQTATGRAFYLDDPKPEDVVIQDIAAALSKIGRFTGHTRGAYAYSVAQHSVHVSELVSPPYRLAALLHDAHEAYIGDIGRPLKEQLRPLIGPMETRIQKAIHDALGLPWPLSGAAADAIKQADSAMLVTERQQLLGTPPKNWAKWEDGAEPVEGMLLTLWPPTVAEARFLKRYEELNGGDGTTGS